MREIGCTLAIACGLLVAQAAKASGFIEVGAERGFVDYRMAPPMGSGAAAADYDNDGDVDLFVPTVEGMGDQLYTNQGTGAFVLSSPLPEASNVRSRSALWMDYDNDRDLDLVVGGDCFGEWAVQPGNVLCRPNRAMLRLYRNDGNGSFVDVTAGSGFADDSGGYLNHAHRGGLAAGDVDRDGDLDLYSAMWFGPTRLYRNNGNGTFSDITSAAGVQFNGANAQWQPVFHDFNGDGYQDIFVAVDFGPNLLWINQGNGTFVDRAAQAGVNSAWNEMGVAIGDYDNDGDFDLYATNVYERVPGEHNVLFRNDSVGGNLAFAEVATAMGVGDTSWGWGTTFLDVDLDGDLDLAATNGFSDSDGAQYPHDRSKFFRNDGSAFVDISDAIGFNDDYWGSALICFDAEGDGYPDLVQTTRDYPNPGPLRLLTNTGTDLAHYVRVVPRAGDANHYAIGAVVRVRTGSLTQSRLITAGVSFLGQEPAEAHFGLSAHARVDELTVTWPDGRITRRHGVWADREVRVSTEDVFVDEFE